MLLVIGGTSEAQSICRALARRRVALIYSRSGIAEPETRKYPPRWGVSRHRNLHRPTQINRIGGFRFGRMPGRLGLLRYVREQRIHRIIDASHPFAHNISNAVAWVARAVGIDLIRIQRKSWITTNLANSHGVPACVWVDTHQEAIARASELIRSGGRVAITSGRSAMDEYLAAKNVPLWARVLAPPGTETSHRDVVWRFARGPFSLDKEIESLEVNDCRVLVTKHSGGNDAKLRAAAQLGIQVVVVRRRNKSGSSLAACVAHNVESTLSRFTKNIPLNR